MKERIGFVCDSTADFPPGVAEKLGLHVLPVHINVDGRDRLDGLSISNTQVIQALKEKCTVYTKPFLPGECADLYDRLLEKYERVVSFHLSTHLSANYRSAVNARKLLFEEDAERLSVIDMGSVSATLGLDIKHAVERLRKEGVPRNLDERMAPQRSEASMWFTVENLHWLKEGGRVSAFAAFVGGVLNIKPIIHLDDARLVPIEKHLGKKTALKRLVEMAVERFRRMQGRCDIWIAYADNLHEVMSLREELAFRINRPVDDIKLVELGATIAVHAGPGSAAISMVPA